MLVHNDKFSYVINPVEVYLKYINAANKNHAVSMYNKFIDHLSISHISSIQSGIFSADMQVKLINDGPTTIWIDSKRRE